MLGGELYRIVVGGRKGESAGVVKGGMYDAKTVRGRLWSVATVLGYGRLGGRCMTTPRCRCRETSIRSVDVLGWLRT